MAVLSQLRDLCRRRLGDTTSLYKFSDDQINQWINDAIAEYSIHFPKRDDTTITTTEDDRTYNISMTGIQSLISVEYPTDEDPPEYLERRNYTDPGFWETDGYYDWIKEGDDTSQLLISEKPPADETITIWYNGKHDYLSVGSEDETTLPERHFELLVLFVMWCAWQSLAAEEGASPDPTNLFSSTFQVNAYRAERAYRALLRETRKDESQSVRMPWDMPNGDRVY